MKKTSLKINRLVLILLIVLLGFVDFSFAQWVNDPSSNTKLVIDPLDPINLTVLKDFNSGGFIFWEDIKNNSTREIYFIHFNKNGEVSVRADGKRVSALEGRKENPVAVVDPSANAIVMWKGYSEKNNPELYIQKLSKSGLRLWKNEGLKLTSSRSEKISYSLCVDKRGYVNLSFIAKNTAALNKYSVGFQRLTSSGKTLSDSLKGVLYKSNNTLSEAKIIPDNKGGAFVFWLEKLNQKIVLRAQYADSTGSKKWGSKPLIISKVDNNVLDYAIGKIGSGIYAAITYQGVNKIIYQNLISDKGNLLWGDEGRILAYHPGSQTNPQFAFVDSSVVVSWTNEIDKIKDVFIQRFDVRGNRMWESNDKKIINIKGNQFGQRIVYDGRNGVILAWIDKREDSPDVNLYIQKVDLNGNFVWDSSAVMISSSHNMEKSYLNLIPDENGGAIAVFKGSSNKKNNIYGQKIFSTGTYASQILGFTTQVFGDSVKIFWYAANENEGTIYSIYRTDNPEADNWEIAGSLKMNKNNEANYYEFFDWPDINGSIYYRIAQKNEKMQTQYSGIEKVDYYRNVESIVLGQNSPNPFSDSTTISFYLPEEEEVSIEFFNSNIETVKKIDNVEYPAGKNEIVFYAEDLTPGIYFYRLKVGKFVDVKKMVITR
ncbi:MAG: T9SS type A sorting domain-containing protein [Ignavibacterium sp.]|nr:T9SS type A sorting domain-containing protein [Ignavibacterium sp.]